MKKEMLKAGEMYRINTPGAKGFATYEDRFYNRSIRMWVYKFNGIELGRVICITTKNLDGVHKMRSQDWKKVQQLREESQDKTIRQYRLSRTDRKYLIVRGLEGSTGVFGSVRDEKSLKKLVKLGLLKVQAGKYGTVNYVLTALGTVASHNIFSA